MQACTMMTQEQFYLIRLHFSSPITSFFSFVDHSSGYNDTSRFRFICRYDTRTFRIAFYWDVKVYLQYNAAVWAFLVVGEWASKILKPEFWVGNHSTMANKTFLQTHFSANSKYPKILFAIHTTNIGISFFTIAI